MIPGGFFSFGKRTALSGLRPRRDRDSAYRMRDPSERKPSAAIVSGSRCSGQREMTSFSRRVAFGATPSRRAVATMSRSVLDAVLRHVDRYRINVTTGVSERYGAVLFPRKS